MRKFTFISLISLLSIQFYSNAQDADTAWKSKYDASLGLSQTTFTNWSSGGENAFAMNANLTIFKNYAKDNLTWGNYLGLAYGLSYMQETDPQWRKIDDKINLVSKAGLHAWKKWYYSGLFEFRSQFDKGYNYPHPDYISKFMAPGYFQLSIGMNYKPVDYFALFLSPIGARLTVVNDPFLTNTLDDKGNLIGAFGVKGDNTTLWQIGASLNMIFKKDIMKNVNLMSKLDLFSDYTHNPQNIIVGWENNILMKVNKYISLSLATMLVYDDNLNYTDREGITHGPRTQFKETFTIGFAYSFAHN
jgi:Protein of unknown function (DUF3078)